MIHVVRRRLWFGSLAVLLLSLPTVRAAEPVSHPVVAGFERFYTTEKADAARGGQLLLGELNCVSCHQSADAALSHKQAPVLDDVGARVHLGYLRKYLNDPQAVKPGSTMPNLFVNDPEREQKVEALVHFLGSRGVLKQERPDAKNVALGRDLYHKVGCVACHGTRNAKGDPETVLPSSVPLGDLKAKYSITSLTAFLENPHAIRPSGRMPKLLTAAKEAREVATYLLQGVKVSLPTGAGTTSYSYYEGSWEKLPDFDKLKAVAQGTGAAFDLAVAKRGQDYGIRFEGYFKAERDASFTFSLTSDDGSRLYVDGALVVDNDGVHAPGTKQGKVKLTKGTHKVTINFFQASAGAELSAHVEAAGVGSQDLANVVSATEAALEAKPTKPVVEDADKVDFQPELVAKGQALFTSSGCANCHQLQQNRKPLVSTLSAQPLAKLTVDKGCLAPAATKGIPWYSLSAAERRALDAAVTTPAPVAKTSAEIVAQTFTTFNCYACHVRDKVGGPLEELNKSFQTTQPEMGDEGRVPPPLDGVGAKLTPAYLKQLLDKGAHDRPYMQTRMPGFGAANVGHLVETFAELDKLPVIPAVAFGQPASRTKATARHLVGGTAFGCIKCHTFAGQKAEGVQGIDMVLMPQRLRRDWFHAYIADPQAIRPGTRMPAAFVKGKSVLPDILDGTAPTQTEAMWLYLSDGKDAQVPVGASAKSIPLVPKESAIIYRNFIEGGGARAIGVGYPEKAHLVFDANEMRFAMLWQGAFIDAARHWTDRGTGYQGPLGDNILKLPAGVPFAVLSKSDEAWPATPAKQQGYRFLGYRLSPDDRPTFLYSLGDVKVEDFPQPIGGKEPSLQRTLSLTAAKPVENLFFRAAVGTKIEAEADGWYAIDGAWKVKLDKAAAPVIRKSGNKMELLVPLRFADGKTQLVQEFKW